MNVEEIRMPHVGYHQGVQKNENSVSKQGFVAPTTQELPSKQSVSDALRLLGIAKKAIVKTKEEDKKLANQVQIKSLVASEEKRLESDYSLKTAEEFKEEYPHAHIDDSGVLHNYKGEIGYTGVISNDEVLMPKGYGAVQKTKKLVEYVDGKPVTMVIREERDGIAQTKLVKYEYPHGSLAATRVEYNVIHDWNNPSGASATVPRTINEEIGLEL